MTAVKPRKGIILAGIPAKGAEIDDKLAEEWLANRLVVPIDADDALPLVGVNNTDPPKRKRGRPKGSKTRKPAEGVS
jgi:hypothetical protein